MALDMVIESPKAKAILRVLQGCNSIKRFQRIHAYVIVNGLQHHSAITNKLLNFCAISVSGSLTYARLLFKHIENPETQDWNSIIRGFAQSPSPLQTILYYNDMLSASLCGPDTFTYSFTLKACERIKAETKCKEVHGSVIRAGYERDAIVCTSLIRAYFGNGSIGTARVIFDNMSERDLVAWNAMISGYAQAGHHQEALEMYEKISNENVGLDGFTLVGLLSSCSHVGALNMGVQLHRIAREKGCIRNIYVGNALIDMYAKCGSLDDALCVFDAMMRRDVFTWNSMIVGFGVHGFGNEAISFFNKMLVAGVQPNSITFLGLLSGCSHQGLVEEGVKYFHQMSSKFNLEPEIKHYGCIVDLYGRAGKLEKALEFLSIASSQGDPVSWRALLASCRIHKNVEIGEIVAGNLVQLGALNAGDVVLLATIYAGAKDANGVSRMRKLIKSQRMETSPGCSWIEIFDQIHKFVVDDKSHAETQLIYKKLKEVTNRAILVGYANEDSLPTILDSCSEEHLETSSSYHSERLAVAFGLAKTTEGTMLRIVKNLRICRHCHSFFKFVSKAFNRDIIVRDRVRFHHFKGGLCSCKEYW